MTTPMKAKFYVDKAGKHRWNVSDGDNGDILGDGGQGYANEADAIHGFERVTGTRVNPGQRTATVMVREDIVIEGLA